MLKFQLDMRYLILLLFLMTLNRAAGQKNMLLLYQKHFNIELKKWSESFDDFNLSDFKKVDTIHFENIISHDFSGYKKFLSVYRPLITYSEDSSQFIDIYSYQLNLEKRGKYYYANPEIDQAVYLCNPAKKYWNRIFFGSGTEWIDDVTWVSKTKFILVGIIKAEGEIKHPVILLGNTNDRAFERYVDVEKTCIQKPAGYYSSTLKRLAIKGL